MSTYNCYLTINMQRLLTALDNKAYLLLFFYCFSEHFHVDGYKCLFTVSGFSKVNFRVGFPPFILVRISLFHCFLGEHTLFDLPTKHVLVFPMTPLEFICFNDSQLQLKEPKIFVHGNIRDQEIHLFNWPGCS